MTIKRFEDLEIWQNARALCKKIRTLTETTPLKNDFSIKDQILRSSGSVMDNIAEGFGRKGNLEFINFLTYSSGSICECKSQLYRAFDRNYITEAKRKELAELSDEVGKMITSLISYLGGTELRGIKFKAREKK